MANAAETADLDTLREDIAALKRQLADLVRHSRSAAAAGAKQAYEGLAEQGEHAAGAASDHVRGAPLASVAVALLVGCVAGRMVR
jgi:ElaB/YqjD/DUF883 family membrane-anchored ribosome-binding protein